jgi:TonB-linked SusC/RagA family outer membrane protein
MRKIFTLLLCIVLCYSSNAQSKTVTGTVTDPSGAPLVGASVVVKGTTTGTTTNGSGSFTINVPSSAKTLVVSYQGYTEQEIAMGNQTRFSIELKTSDRSLDEVVVTGYQAVRKRDVASAISKISAADIENLPMPNFAQAMQGRAAGVIVAAANGVPGGSLSVIIRGAGSISAGVVPLYVVDGVQINTTNTASATQNNPLNFLNPDDVESIEILKDAAAASIYGARAANGVVIVTTKKGRAGKTKFTFNTFLGQSTALRVLDVTNAQEWYQVRYEAVANSNPLFTPAAIRNTVLSNMGLSSTSSQGKVDSLPFYDWQDVALRTGTVANAELSMQGGTQNVNFYVSGSYSKQDAFIRPVDFKRGALLSKLSLKVNNKITFDNTLSLSTVTQRAPYSLGNTGFGNPAYAAPQILPHNPIYNPDGTYYGLFGSGQAIAGSFNHNLAAVADLAKFKTTTNQLVGSGALTYKVIPALTLRGFASLDYRSVIEHNYYDPRLNDFAPIGGLLYDQHDWNVNFLTNATANYQKLIREKHSVNVLTGVEYRRDVNEYFTSSVQGFPTHLLQYASAGSALSSQTGQWSASATFSQFGKLGYTFNNKYVFNYTIRRDGSSRFGPNNRYGVFQSAQVAWNAKEESFLKGVRQITDLKLRYSYGEAGNDQIGNVLFRQLYGATRLYGGQGAINPTQLGNPDLSWETRMEHNIGLDVSFFKNRLSLTADAYKKVNRDLLLSRSLYATTGFTSITQNLGAIENKGLELLLTATPIQRKFKWTTSFNIAFQANKVKELYDSLQILPGDATTQVGQPLGSFFTPEWAGVNPATGRGMWYDINGNITYTPTNADRKIVGNIYPTHFGGWNNSFSYGGFSLEAFFQYEYGRIRQDQQLQQMMRMGGAITNVDKRGFDRRWQQPGDITDVPRPANAMTEQNSVAWSTGTRFLAKTDYVRLKQLTLSHELKSSAVKNLSLQAVRFYVQGINLWTYTKWEGYDPEFTGANVGIIPQGKNITVGLRVTF